MRILLSNDDGISASGLQALSSHLRTSGHQLHVVAPSQDRSGASHSLTLDRPLRVEMIDSDTYSVTGTPTDCVHLALTGLIGTDPDIVISGINNAANLGDDTLYSGTVAAAMEGRFLGFPAIAVSLVTDSQSPTLFYATAAQVVESTLKHLKAHPLPGGIVLNINVPNVPWVELTGIKMTRLGKRQRATSCNKVTDPRGKIAYWIGAAGEADDGGNATDFHAVRNGAVSVTPLHADMTHHHMLSTVSEWVTTWSEQTELHA